MKKLTKKREKLKWSILQPISYESEVAVYDLDFGLTFYDLFTESNCYKPTEIDLLKTINMYTGTGVIYKFLRPLLKTF